MVTQRGCDTSLVRRAARRRAGCARECGAGAALPAAVFLSRAPPCAPRRKYSLTSASAGAASCARWASSASASEGGERRIGPGVGSTPLPSAPPCWPSSGSRPPGGGAHARARMAARARPHSAAASGGPGLRPAVAPSPAPATLIHCAKWRRGGVGHRAASARREAARRRPRSPPLFPPLSQPGPLLRARQPRPREFVPVRQPGRDVGGGPAGGGGEDGGRERGRASTKSLLSRPDHPHSPAP